jgi:two-component system chemotaxis response regulator CheB
LVVDDSALARLTLVHLLEADPEIAVIGAVSDGQAAIDFIAERLPDAVVMDIHMPGMDGFETTRRIMETRPVPIVVCTAITNAQAIATSFRALEAGAVASVEKPLGPQHPEFERSAAHLRQTVKLMSEVKVVRRWPKLSLAAPPAAARPPGAALQLIGIGASTGGPAILQQILAGLPKDFPLPILVVQHIAEGFLSGLADWLHETTGFSIQIAAYGVLPLPGRVYLAPDGFQMGINFAGRILLTKELPENGLRPSVSYLFRSLAVHSGAAAVGVLLTGMGRDGAAELRLMKDAGAVTIAQDLESSVVHGMPGAAVELGGATHVLAGDAIAARLIALSHRNRPTENKL